MTRLEVRKAYQLFIGGEIVSSESTQTYPVYDHREEFLGNVAQATGDDLSRAVDAARESFAAWAGLDAYQRGRALYRIAELLEGRRDQFAAAVKDGEGLAGKAAQGAVHASIDRWIWYAGWADKLDHVLGHGNQVSGPYTALSQPAPTGVVVVIAPEESSLLGLVSVIAPALVPGNTVVVIASHTRPIPAIDLAEVLATSDVPDGVVNILTGDVHELGQTIARHRDVNGLDLAGIHDHDLATTLEAEAASTLTRVRRPEPDTDWAVEPGIDRLRDWSEIKTIWHTRGF